MDPLLIWMVSRGPPPLCCRHLFFYLSFHTARKQPSSQETHFQSLLSAPTSLSPQLPAVSRTTSKQARKWSHQQPASTLEKTNVAVLNQPKNGKEYKPAPAKRERGNEWATPDSSGALPKPLEACDRSLYYPSTREIGSLCLIHSWTVSDSNSYLCRGAVKYLKFEWFVLHRHTHKHTHSTCTLDILSTSCAVGLFYYAAWNCRLVCSYVTISQFIYAQGFLFEVLTFQMLSLWSLLCHNLVKALALQRSKEEFAVRPASPYPPQLLLPTFYCCLTTSSQTPSHPLPAHLSSPFIPTGQ